MLPFCMSFSLCANLVGLNCKKRKWNDEWRKRKRLLKNECVLIFISLLLPFMRNTEQLE